MPVLIVATSHIASESVKEVEDTILKTRPDCVAVELDRLRYESLKIQQQNSGALFKTLGPSTFLIIWIFKKLQQWLGSKVGILPGSEMMKAIEIAKQNNIKIALIDQDIAKTLYGIKSMPKKEKLKLAWYLIKAPVLLKLHGKHKNAIDLSKVPEKEIVEQAICFLEKEFPSLHNVLIDERNRHMAEKIKALEKQFENIVVVVGAGHKQGLEGLLKI